MVPRFDNRLPLQGSVRVGAVDPGRRPGLAYSSLSGCKSFDHLAALATRGKDLGVQAAQRAGSTKAQGSALGFKIPKLPSPERAPYLFNPTRIVRRMALGISLGKPETPLERSVSDGAPFGAGYI